MSNAQDLLPLSVQILGTLIFSLVFAFLWRQSGITYFGYWALAWIVECVAQCFTLLAAWSGVTGWLAVHSLLEFGFALSILAGARVGSSRPRNWKSSLRVLLFFPIFLAVVYGMGWQRHGSFAAAHSLVLSAIYYYSFLTVGLGSQTDAGVGRRLFRFTLLGLSLLFLHNGLAYLYIRWHGMQPSWLEYINYLNLYDFGLQMLLAFSAMGMWIEDQNDRIQNLAKELDGARRESAGNRELDLLTGLLNRTALESRLQDPAGFTGVAAVCDLDQFKSINDRLGHLVGDEILRNVGNLLRSSVRPEDEAFRWGGDEFVILFRNQNLALASQRMVEIQERLKTFRVRGHGLLTIDFSWGTAESHGAPLHPALDAADRNMYEHKRSRRVARQ